jgi:hypothetical protein
MLRQRDQGVGSIMGMDAASSTFVLVPGLHIDGYPSVDGEIMA